jgi:hypothetical protein
VDCGAYVVEKKMSMKYRNSQPKILSEPVNLKQMLVHNPMWTGNAGSRVEASSEAVDAVCLKFSEYPGRSLADDGMGISEMKCGAEVLIHQGNKRYFFAYCAKYRSTP